MQRFRSTTSGGFSTVVTRYQYGRALCTDGWGSPSITTNYNVGLEKVKSISDEMIPNFKALKRCGGFLPINDCDISTVETQRVPGTFSHDTSGGGCLKGYASGQAWIAVTGASVVIPALDNSVISSVVNSAAANAKASTWDLLTEFAEAGETLRFLQGGIGAFFKNFQLAADNLYRRRLSEISAYQAALRAYEKALEIWKGTVKKKGKPPRRPSATHIPEATLSQCWLEYRYAAAPAVRSINDAVKAALEGLQEKARVTGRASFTVPLSGYSKVVSHPSSVLTVTEEVTLTGTRTYRGFAYAEIDSPALHRTGFDPIVTAYELLRLSFVIDWFINVGAWLQAISPFAGAHLVGVGYSVHDTYTLTSRYSQLYGGSSGGFTHTGSGSCTTIVTVSSYTRRPSSVSLPSWNIRLTNFRYIDIWALIMTGFKDVNRSLRGL